METVLSNSRGEDLYSSRMEIREEQFTRTFEVDSPDKWTAETPNLYFLKLSLYEKDEVIETIMQPIGFRKVELKGAVKGIGEYTAVAKLHPEISAEFAVTVAAE